MRKQNRLTKTLMWNATISCDSTYDGIFFYAVKTTGIFCRPSCKSKVPNHENVAFFPNANEAQKAGFRPCKRCRPDLNTKTYDPFETLLQDTKHLLANHYTRDLSLQDIASEVGVSRFHLNRVFKERTGDTPRMYLEKIRIEKAKELLSIKHLNSTEIAYQIGYQSVSSFYTAFKRNTGIAPNQFRTYHATDSIKQDFD